MLVALLALDPADRTTLVRNGGFNIQRAELVCAYRNRADNFAAFLFEFIDPLLDVWADIFERGRNRHHFPARGNPARIVFVVGDPFPVDHIEFAQNRVGPDIIVLVTVWHRIRGAGHLRCKVADIHQHIVSRLAPLQHGVAALQIAHPALRLVKPRRVAVERGAKRGVFSGHPAITGLMEIDVQHEMIDPVTEHPFTPRLERVGSVREVESAGKCLGIRALLSVGMGNGAGCAAFDIPQASFRPELTAHLVGIATVNGEITRESPMPVRFAPEHQSMFIRHIPQATQITFGNHIGHGPAQIPEELVRLSGAVDHRSGQYGQQRDRTISIAPFKLGGEAVGPIL